MNYEIVRSKRKTLAMTVDKNGRVIVRAPLKYPIEEIERFVGSKSEWLEKHTSAANDRNSERIRRLSAPPEALPFLGELVSVVNEQPYGYSDGCFKLPENRSLESLIPYLRKLYMNIAKETLAKRTALLADRMNIRINAVKINSAKTRWGSCSAQKNINLSWKLIAADSKLIDYVIVHELCHTMHMNHSPSFWAEVERYIPDYIERREALKDVQQQLSEYGLE